MHCLHTVATTAVNIGSRWIPVLIVSNTEILVLGNRTGIGGPISDKPERWNSANSVEVRREWACTAVAGFCSVFSFQFGELTLDFMCWTSNIWIWLMRVKLCSQTLLEHGYVLLLVDVWRLQISIFIVKFEHLCYYCSTRELVYIVFLTIQETPMKVYSHTLVDA